jgi:hypothetical protein
MTFLVALAAPALAAWPHDLDLAGMADQDGSPIAEPVRDDYLTLIRELGIAVANRPVVAETPGASGFSLAAPVDVAFITSQTDDGSPSAWERASPDESAPAALLFPGLEARKGLPWSVELGFRVAWMASTRQGVVAGQGRVALLEGWKPWPDVTLHAGYAGYVGNDQLELGVLDLGVTVGTTWAFGSVEGIRNAQFSPFLDYTTLRVSANPLLGDAVAERIGAVPVSARKDAADYEPAMVIPQLGGGFQVTNGTVSMRIVGTWAPRAIATLTVGMGFNY